MALRILILRSGASGHGSAIPRTLADHTRLMDTPGRIGELERKFAENPRRYFAALANEFRKQGDLDRAIELCESHLAEQRNHLSGHVVLAQALVDAGRESAAWDPLHTALDIDPENFIALRLLGELSAKVGDADHARTFFFRALEIEPRNEQILTAVKNLSPRPASLEAEPAEPMKPAAALAPESDSWRDITPLPGLESTTAFEAVEAAEPVAEEPPEEAFAEPKASVAVVPERAAEVPSPEEHAPAEPMAEEPAAEEVAAGKAAADETVAEEAPAEKHAAEEALAEEPADEEAAAEESVPSTAVGAPGESDPFSEWVPSAESPAESIPEEDWMSVAGSAATGGSYQEPAVTSAASQEKPYDYHDWLPAPARDISDSDAASVESAAAAPTAADAAEPDAAGRAQDGEVAAPPEAESGEARPVLASETMVDLYLEQGHVALAVEVLRELVASRPTDERLQARLAELGRAPAPPPRETVRDMFARFARTAEPLRARSRPGAFTPHGADRVEPGGPLAEFFGDAASPTDAARVNALLAMVAPAGPAPSDDDALGQWLGGLRRQ